MELKQLEAFVNVADLKSFSKAADKLFLTQPTISSQISTLEKELGCRLFERTTKSLRLSAEGEKLYPYAVRMIDIRNNMLSETGRAKREICIGASTIPSGYLLPGLITGFMRRNDDPGSRSLSENAENVTFHIRQGDSREVEEMVEDGSVEFGIIGREPLGTGIDATFLCSDELVLVTPNYHRFRPLIRAKDLDTLLREPVILREEGSGTRDAVEKLLHRPLNITISSNDQESIKQMVAGGAGISFISRFAVRDIEKTGSVLVMPISEECRRDFFLISKKNHALSGAVREFADHCISTLSGQ